MRKAGSIWLRFTAGTGKARPARVRSGRWPRCRPRVPRLVLPAPRPSFRPWGQPWREPPRAEEDKARPRQARRRSFGGCGKRNSQHRHASTTACQHQNAAKFRARSPPYARAGAEVHRENWCRKWAKPRRKSLGAQIYMSEALDTGLARIQYYRHFDCSQFGARLYSDRYRPAFASMKGMPAEPACRRLVNNR